MASSGISYMIVCSHGPRMVMSISPGRSPGPMRTYFSLKWKSPRKSTKSDFMKRSDREARRAARAHRWGLIPHWAKDSAIGNRLANARGESLAERPAFRDAFRQWRCLVPASGFYEWQTRAGRKYPWYIRPLDAELFALAGIPALWRGVRRVSF